MRLRRETPLLVVPTVAIALGCGAARAAWRAQSPRVEAQVPPSPSIEVDTGVAARAAIRLARVRRLRLLVAEGANLLEREDPVRALRVLRGALAIDFDDVEARLGIGSCHLLLGAATVALRYARSVQSTRPDCDDAIALEIRALIRGRRFRQALECSTAAVLAALRSGVEPGLETLAAHGSALFRTQNNDESARIYRKVLERDPRHAEANLRLGSGLTEPRTLAVPSVDLRAGVAAARAREFEVAIGRYLSVLREEPGNPIAHRLLGEALTALEDCGAMVAQADEFRWLERVLPTPSLARLPVTQFMPAFGELDRSRRAVATRGLALFSSRLGRLVSMGGRHDLIVELERTTDHAARANLRGRRTFDGRVWDDVRGIGGLRAATGIEALDEAAGHGFDTLAHELAHQAHLYAFPRRVRTEIRRLYRSALDQGRCLDFYAASNDAEYFGQGVEAFVSLAKRPGSEATHGHTRFELMRVDPELYRLIQRMVDFDPLDPTGVPTAVRHERLRASIAAALCSGRAADAVTAAALLPDGVESRALRELARSARVASRSY